MNPRNLILFSVLLPSLSLVAKEKPNVVLIVVDDLGYGDISCYGNEYIQTPNIDKMAADGVKMTDFHTNGAVSSPTRAALMTGRYQQRSGITGVITAANDRDKGLALDEYTIAEAFKDAGYTTAIYGKWHLGYDSKFNPTYQGFDYFEGYVSGNIDYHAHIDQSNYKDWWNGTKLVEQEGYSTDLIGQKSVKFIAEHKDEPFFLYIPHEAPHYPIQGRNSPAIRGKKAVKNQPKQTAEQIQATYKEIIEVMDETVGDVIAALKEHGLADNTIVMFISDNGGASRRASNAPFSGSKGGFKEGGHRVPAVMWSSGIKLAPSIPYIYESTVMTMDLFPSFIKFVGGKVPRNLDGIDFLTAMKKGKSLAERDLFWAADKKSAMRQGDWKLLKDAKGAQLYNLAEDIKEKKNLATEYPERFEAMKKATDDWAKEVAPVN